MENPFRDAFYAYAKTRRGLSTVNYDMIVGIIKKADLFVPPAFNESVFQREFKRAYGLTGEKERDFQEFNDVCQKIIAPLLAKAKGVDAKEATKAMQDAIIAKQPKSVSEKIIK
ncbi:unnamed protein product [Calicophoron daubneyi]|uniref:Uncharacterized protein n=1 Tax=Calicophoron daubneyi TaxID=300641 RepID=A0AAV2TG52_CALDB